MKKIQLGKALSTMAMSYITLNPGLFINGDNTEV